jgi:hypothetical protein
MLAFLLPLLAANQNYSDTSLGVVRGAEVINRCTEKSAESGSFCFAYIGGVFDSVRAYETWLNIKEFCIPAGTPQSELRDVVVAHIEKNPNDRLGQGASVVIRALKQRYPCATPTIAPAPMPAETPTLSAPAKPAPKPATPAAKRKR